MRPRRALRARGYVITVLVYRRDWTLWGIVNPPSAPWNSLWLGPVAIFWEKERKGV